MLPLNSGASAAFGLVMAMAAHTVGWPMARGGSSSILNALVACAREEGVTVELERRVDVMRRDVAMLDGLHEQTLQSIGHLDAFIAAGKAFAQEFKTGRLASLKTAAAAPATGGTGDLIAAQALGMAQRAASASRRLLPKSGRLRWLPPPLSAWTKTRDAPVPPPESFRLWWARTHGGDR